MPAEKVRAWTGEGDAAWFGKRRTVGVVGKGLVDMVMLLLFSFCSCSLFLLGGWGFFFFFLLVEVRGGLVLHGGFFHGWL